MLRSLLIVMLVIAVGSNCFANAEITHSIDKAKVVGKARLSFMLWDVYDATLYAPEGVWQKDKPFVLSLHYLRDIKGRDIADRSVQEIRKQGYKDEIILAAWHSQMRNIFPDVRNGTVLSAVFTPGKDTRFYEADRLIGTIKGDLFAECFFGIWLSENTSEPLLRKKLLGLV